MARSGRPKAELTVTDQERETLQRWARRPKSAQQLALRSKIVLACAEGKDNKAVAAELAVHQVTVGKWRSRFVADRLEGLADEDRPGRPRTVTDEKVEEVIVKTLEETPAECDTHWSTRSMAEGDGHVPDRGLPDLAGVRAQAAPGGDASSCRPTRCSSTRSATSSGLYLDPPERALVLCVDEKSQIQALNRTAPCLPMMPGTPARRSHDYVRHGTTSLFAALDMATGQVIGRCTAGTGTSEFKKFLNQIDTAVPADLDVHLICDNYATHKTPEIKRWLLRHPRFHLHFTPTSSSWLNMVERWFAELTTKQDPPRRPPQRQRARSRHQRLDRSMERRPRPYVWTKTADEILENLAGYLQRINNSGH